MTKYTISQDRLGFWNVYITHRPLFPDPITGLYRVSPNIVKTFNTKHEAEMFLENYKRMGGY